MAKLAFTTVNFTTLLLPNQRKTVIVTRDIFPLYPGEKLRGKVCAWPTYQNSYPIYDQTLRFSLLYS